MSCTEPTASRARRLREGFRDTPSTGCSRRKMTRPNAIVRTASPEVSPRTRASAAASRHATSVLRWRALGAASTSTIEEMRGCRTVRGDDLLAVIRRLAEPDYPPCPPTQPTCERRMQLRFGVGISPRRTLRLQTRRTRCPTCSGRSQCSHGQRPGWLVDRALLWRAAYSRPEAYPAQRVAPSYDEKGSRAAVCQASTSTASPDRCWTAMIRGFDHDAVG
jgi:hypothetical protein